MQLEELPAEECAWEEDGYEQTVNVTYDCASHQELRSKVHFLIQSDRLTAQALFVYVGCTLAGGKQQERSERLRKLDIVGEIHG